MNKAVKVFKNALCIALILVFLLISFVTLCGAKGYSVATNSMNPELKKGDVVFVKECSFEELKVGDVVTVEFKTGGGTYTHRIAEIDYDKKEIKTAGDKTGNIDQESAEKSQIKGKVWFSIPLLGFLSLALTSRAYGAAVALAAALVIVLGFVIGKSSKKERGDKNEHQKETDS